MKGNSASFRRPEIIRPPSEWRSYYLPVTGGCSNNRCTFCGFYGSKLQVRDVEEVKEEIDAVAIYRQSRVCLAGMPTVVYAVAHGWDGKRVFLQDGDALVYPYERLREVLEYLNQRMPHVDRIGMYSTPQDLLRRSVGELEELRRLKVGILYMGVESGDEEVLGNVGKGVTRDEIIDAGRRAREAGIMLSVTVILGLGGAGESEKHALETARVLTAIDPEYAGALTLTLVPGTPLHEQRLKGSFKPISPFRSLEELRLIVENASFTDCFFSSMHASNYLAVRGRLPVEKEKMVGDLERVLREGDPSLLRPEFLRGL